MLYSLISVFAPMLLGAQIILTLVLVKGEICPGQRGRIHKVLPALAVLWLAVASIKIEAFLVVFALFYFYSQVQTKKTREEGPLWVMYLANGLALAYVGILISEAPAMACIAHYLCGNFPAGCDVRTFATDTGSLTLTSLSSNLACGRDCICHAHCVMPFALCFWFE